MARKPNYSFERNQRAKAKAAKREAKRQAKLAKAKTKDTAASDTVSDSSPGAETKCKASEKRAAYRILFHGYHYLFQR